MKKTLATMTIAGAALIASAAGVSAGSPTCADTFGWKNHGEHVLDYVNGDGAGGGAPAHHGADPAPGASFCLTQAKSPGQHF